MINHNSKNEKSMSISGRKRIRLVYEPLNVAVSIKCDMPYVQSYYPTGEYIPDRASTPTVIQPVVNANASDGSWDKPNANASLSDIKWYANGEDITTLSDWMGYFEIDMGLTETRGAISIKKNLRPTEQVSLRFTASLDDPRMGDTIPINSDPVVLSTVEGTSAAYSIGLSEDTTIQYNPFADKLLLYDYKVAHGLVSANSAAQSEADDSNSYNRIIGLTLYKGGIPQQTGFSVKLFAVTHYAQTEMTSGTDEVTGVSPIGIGLDLRLVTKKDYIVRAYVGEQEVAMKQFSVGRVSPTFRCRPTNGTYISPNDTLRYDKVMVDYGNNIVDCPGNILSIIWKTDTLSMKGVTFNEGQQTLFSLARTYIGNSDNDSWIDVYTEASLKPAYSIAVDESGNILTDGSDTLIFN